MEANGQRTIEYSSLVLKCRLAVQSILNLHILEAPGEHGKGVFRVRLEPGQETGQSAGTDETAALWICDGQGRLQMPLFSGCLEKVLIREEGGYQEAELTVLSGTVLLDRKKKDRVFQNTSMGYRELTGRILGDNEGSVCILSGEDREIGNPFFQYRETDWEFLKRAAARLGVPLVADCMVPRPRFYLGLREGEMRELPETENARWVMEGERYYRLRGKEAPVERRDFWCYDVTTAVNMALGERVQVEGRLLYVSRKETELKDGRVLFTYRLAGKGYSCVAPYDNEKLTGLELPARVTGTGGEMCELSLDIDPGQEGGHEYPYAPMTGNLMYCMPREQTRAYLRLGSSSEGSGMVSRCIRTNGEECEDMASPEQRSFHTEHGKGLELGPGSLGFVSAGTGSLTLCDEEGVSLGSTGGITLHAGGSILVESGGSICLDALTQITGQSLMATFSAFCMNDRFDYLSSRTLFQGTEIRRYRPFGDAPVKGEFDTWGFVRNLVYGVVVAAALTVAAVCTGGAALFVGAAIGAGVTTAVVSATDYSTGNVKSYEEAKRDIDSAAIIGAATGAVAFLLSGVTIFANPYADMAVKEVIESYVGMKTGILLRSFEAIGMAPEEQIAYIYDWKTLLLEFGMGSLTGIGVGGAGIALKSIAGEVMEQAAKEAAEEMLEEAAERAAREAAEEITEEAAERMAREAAEEITEEAAERAAREAAEEITEEAAERAAREAVEGGIGEIKFDIDEIRPQLKTEPDTAFFWSGKTDGIGGADVAAEIAEGKGGVTLESTIDAKGITMPEWDFNNPSSMDAWDMASAAYAEQVSGEVRAVVGAELRPGNIWENVELPRLMENPKVTKITIIDPKTGIETVVFER